MTDHDAACGCFRCRISSIHFAPSAMPSRANRVAPTTPNPAWEKGIVTDERNMPILRPGTASPMGTKEYAERRHEIDEARRRLRQSTSPQGVN